MAKVNPQRKQMVDKILKLNGVILMEQSKEVVVETLLTVLEKHLKRISFLELSKIYVDEVLDVKGR